MILLNWNLILRFICLNYCFKKDLKPPYVFRIEATPIALPAISSPIDGTMSPVQSIISNSPITSLASGGNNFNNTTSIAMNIYQKRRESVARLSTSLIKD
jgi:hypothetical protein